MRPRTWLTGGSTLLLLAGTTVPANAATIDVSNLSSAVTITEGDRSEVTDQRTLLCGNGELDVYVQGARDAVAMQCNGLTLTATITPTQSTKSRSVVKFRLRKSNDSSAVLTLVVRVTR